MGWHEYQRACNTAENDLQAEWWALRQLHRMAMNPTVHLHDKRELSGRRYVPLAKVSDALIHVLPGWE